MIDEFMFRLKLRVVKLLVQPDKTLGVRRVNKQYTRYLPDPIRDGCIKGYPERCSRRLMWS